jgi:crotonobetainyl-CoA:carnitine CoA-transferase CaiB-like acyl-CoA transferase
MGLTGPLSGLRVVEMSHMIMGPSCGLILAQLGAEVIKVEPPGGDKTRTLGGMGAGFFPVFSRGKRSITLDLHTGLGREAMFRLLATADVFIENFKDKTIEDMGLDAATLERQFPRLLIASHKGFLSGPYESRPALDEVVQMLSGLAYMTGSREKPMRAGASVNDIMGGLFGAVGLLAMLQRREKTGKGGRLRVGLFENSLFLVAQHIAQFQVTGRPVSPMSQREHTWPIYDIFTSADGVGVFVAVTTDTAWRRFCQSFQLTELLEDPRLDTTLRRMEERPSFLPKVVECLSRFTAADLEARLEGLSIPFARVNSPEEVLDDPHVKRSGGVVRVQDLHGRDLRIPALPIELDGGQAAPAESVAPVGADNAQLFAELGFSPGEIRQLETATSKSA